MSDYTIIETGEAHGLPYVIIQLRDGRGPLHHCGYVGVPDGHPWYGVAHYHAAPDDVRRAAAAAGADPVQYAIDHAEHYGEHSPGAQVEVHGGLTWSDTAPSSGADDRASWWFGFDAGHAGDLRRPTDGPYPTGWGSIAYYVTASDMRAECVALARLLAERGRR